MSGTGQMKKAPKVKAPHRPNYRNTLLRFADARQVTACLEPGFAEHSLRFTIRGRDTVLLLDHALIHHCFVANADNYVHSPIRKKIMQPVFGDGMIMADGEKWKRLRKSVTTVFSAERLASYARTMHEICDREFATFDPARGPVRLADMISNIAFEIMSVTLFSGAFSAERDDFLADISQVMAAFGTSEALEPGMAPYWLPQLSGLRDFEAIARCRDRIGSAVERRLDGRDDATGDLLDAFIAGADPATGDAALAAHLANNVMGFVIPGHETSAVALGWLLYMLSQAPAVLARARAEAEELRAGSVPPERWHEAAPWLRACIEEAMRLRPPVPLIPRKAVRADRFGDCAIAPGSLVMIVPGLLHRLHRYWDESDMFDPERFLGERRAAQQRFSYLPFGIGPKTCIGSGLAMRELVIMTAEFIRRFDFDYASDRPPRPLLRLSTYPDNGVPMRISRRAAS